MMARCVARQAVHRAKPTPEPIGAKRGHRMTARRPPAPVETGRRNRTGSRFCENRMGIGALLSIGAGLAKFAGQCPVAEKRLAIVSTFRRIESAVATHLNGGASALQRCTSRSTCCLSSRTLVKELRRMARPVMSANQRSTSSSLELQVGVKCM